jgi:hypothetical protein
MTIEEAIKKAIEGGYKFPDLVEPYRWESLYGLPAIYPIFLDPKFWQSLGKAMGWAKEICFICGSSEIRSGKEPSSPDNPGDYYENCKRCGAEWMSRDEFEDGNAIAGWLYRWHKFVDHLAEGKTAEDYFKTL